MSTDSVQGITDSEIEREIVRKQLTAPRVTPEMIEEFTQQDSYFIPFRPDGKPRLTFCFLELANGYTVVGKSVCVSPDNYDEELGKRIAKQDALDQCWALFGFQLASELSGTKLTR